MISKRQRRTGGQRSMLAACFLAGLAACRLDERSVSLAADPLSPGAAGLGNGSADAGSLGQSGNSGGAPGAGGLGAAGSEQGASGSAGNGALDEARGGASGAGTAIAGPGDAGAEGVSNPSCTLDADCDTARACTTSRCQNGACVSSPAAPGTPCGNPSDDACTNPDSCDAQGDCQRNDEPLGTACPGGSCIGGQCIGAASSVCAVDVVDSVPVTLNWSSVGRADLFDGGCDSQGTPDYALVFIAPATATYRIAATALVDAVPYTGAGEPTGILAGPADGDSVMTVVEGNCAGNDAAQVACNDDVALGNTSSQLDLQLTAQRIVTVYLNELTQTGGGTGMLSITRLP